MATEIRLSLGMPIGILHLNRDTGGKGSVSALFFLLATFYYRRLKTHIGRGTTLSRSHTNIRIQIQYMNHLF